MIKPILLNLSIFKEKGERTSANMCARYIGRDPPTREQSCPGKATAGRDAKNFLPGGIDTQVPLSLCPFFFCVFALREYSQSGGLPYRFLARNTEL